MFRCHERIEQVRGIKKKAKVCAILWTIIYVVLFPLLSYFALFSAMVFDSPHISLLNGLSIIFIISLIPLSLPVSIDLMWSSYVCEEYRKTLIFWSVPWLTFISVLALSALVQFLGQ